MPPVSERPALKGRRLEQTHLDFGQDGIGPRRCPDCGMLFDRSAEDTARHKKFCSAKDALSAKEAWAALERRIKAAAFKPTREVATPLGRTVVMPVCDVVRRVVPPLLSREALSAVEKAVVVVSRTGKVLMFAACLLTSTMQLCSVEEARATPPSPASTNDEARESSPSPEDPEAEAPVVLHSKSFPMTITGLAVPPQTAPAAFFAPKSALDTTAAPQPEAVLRQILQTAVYGVACAPTDVLFAPAVGQQRVVQQVFSVLGGHPHLLLT